MAMIEIDRNPPERHLVVFATILPLLPAFFGALRWHAGSQRLAIALWVAAVLVALVLLLVPATRRPLYVGWMIATSPIAWLVSHAVLLAIHALVTTPTALMLRAFGRDPMQRRFDREAASYWIARDPKIAPTRYFRQS